MMIRFLLVGFVTAAVSACASTGAVPRPFPLPAGAPAAAPPRTEPSAVRGSVPADGYSVSSTALSLRGAPYRNGGVDPGGFDCSGLVKYVFEQHGLVLPRETRQQYVIGRPVEPSSLEPGDLVFFTTVAPGASHVGIVIGGDQFVHAPATNGVVRVESLSSEYWSRRFIGARRVN